MSELKKTPLNAAHRALGAKMVDFGGWDMPVQYPAGIIAEHVAVRTKVGLFDVSHMGEIRVKGPQAMAFLDWLTPNAVVKLAHGQIHYSAFLYENGTFVDDLLLHKIADDHFLLVVNASNVDKDFAWVKQHAAKWDVEVTNESDETGQVALQGPLSIDVLQPLVDIDLSQIKYYWFAFGKFKGMPAMFARTGYTGEDGFEVIVPEAQTVAFWNALLDAGVKPAVATFVGCFLMGLLCALAARLFDMEKIIMTVPTVLVSIPGSAALRTLIYFDQADVVQAMQNGVATVLAVIAMVAGLSGARMLTDPEWAFTRTDPPGTAWHLVGRMFGRGRRD
jgi:sarcosine oxidase gamma subunit